MPNTFNNAKVSLTSTATTDIYQAPTSTGSVSIILSNLVSNRSAATTGTVTVTLTDSGNTTQSTILNACPVPINTALETVTNKIVLKAGEKLRVQAATTTTIDVTLSCLEITP